MVNIETLANRLQRHTEWQKTPGTLYLEDYCDLVHAALKRLFIVTGRVGLYDEAKMTYEDQMPVSYGDTLQTDEMEWVMITAEIDFFRKVQMDVNNAFGYSTDALTVTNADKPYANLEATINRLEHTQRLLFYKMPRFTLL